MNKKGDHEPCASLLRIAFAKWSSTLVDQFRLVGQLCFSSQSPQQRRSCGRSHDHAGTPWRCTASRRRRCQTRDKWNAGGLCFCVFRVNRISNRQLSGPRSFIRENPKLAIAIVAEGIWDVTQFIPQLEHPRPRDHVGGAVGHHESGKSHSDCQEWTKTHRPST